MTYHEYQDLKEAIADLENFAKNYGMAEAEIGHGGVFCKIYFEYLEKYQGLVAERRSEILSKLESMVKL